MNQKKDSSEYYANSLKLLTKSQIPFLIGGAYAVKKFSGTDRVTNDLDIFCKTSDYPKILQLFREQGHNIEITDARWLAKIPEKEHPIDIIFNQVNEITPVDDTWFENAPIVNLFGVDVRLIPPEELIWIKSYVQNRSRFDGADICHIILTNGKNLDWKRLLTRMESDWEILLAHIINFRFIYPSDRNIVPKWVMDELLSRIKIQLEVPNPKDKICRGSLLSRSEYNIDIKEWGFKDIT